MALLKLDPFERGDTPFFRINLTNNGSPIDLTGKTVFFTLTPDETPQNDSRAIIKRQQTFSDNSSLGVFEVQTLNSETELLTPGETYYWDIQIKDVATGFVFTPIKGTVGIGVDYTRRIA